MRHAIRPAWRDAARGRRGVSSLLPFTDLFTRSDGDLGNGWDYVAGKWTIASEAAVGNPTYGSNLLPNGTFDDDSGWTKGAGWTINTGGSGVAEKAPGTASNLLASPAPLIANRWYYGQFELVTRIAGAFRQNIGGSLTGDQNVPNTYKAILYGTSTAAGTTGDAAAEGTVDNVVVQAIPQAESICTRDFLTMDIDISVPLVISNDVTRTAVGLVLCVDSKDNPLNFLSFTMTRAFLVMYSVVNGVYTSLTSGAAVPVANQVLRVRKIGNLASMFYNGTQIGTTQDVSALACISNTRHGMMSMYGGNTFASFSAVNP